VTARLTAVFAGLAVVLTAVAIYAATTVGLAVAAAAGAVVAGGLAIAEAAVRTLPIEPGPRPPAAPPRSRIRDWLWAGNLGREELVALLDRIERRTTDPGLPARSPQEIESIVRLRPEELRRYLDRRLARLEGTT